MNFAKKLDSASILVILSESRKKINIPIKWIQENTIDAARLLMYGIKTGEDRLIFHSNNKNRDADFNLPIRTDFSTDEDACYIARVLRAFSKLFA